MSCSVSSLVSDFWSHVFKRSKGKEQHMKSYRWNWAGVFFFLVSILTCRGNIYEMTDMSFM